MTSLILATAVLMMLIPGSARAAYQPQEERSSRHRR